MDDVPPLIDNLTKGTAFSNRLLIEAWDGLTLETKFEILDRYDGWILIFNEVSRKVLSDPNPYIRYLAATVVRNHGDATLRERISKDTSELVRAPALIHFPKSSDDWMHLSQLERLYAINEHPLMLGIYFVEFIKGAVGKISDDDLADLVKEHCKSETTKTYPPMKDEFNAMWKLVGTVPEKIYTPVLWHYPAEAEYHSVPDEVLEGMDDKDLKRLIDREDALLPDIRKRIEESRNKFSDEIVSANRSWKSRRPDAGVEAPPQKNQTYLHKILMFMWKYLWLIVTDVITVLVVLAIFAHTEAPLQTIMFSILAIIYMAVLNVGAGMGQANLVTLHAYMKEFSTLKKLLKDPELQRYENELLDVEDNLRTANVRFYIHLVFSLIVWFIAVWELLGVIL